MECSRLESSFLQTVSAIVFVPLSLVPSFLLVVVLALVLPSLEQVSVPGLPPSLEEAEELADRIGIMSHGRLVAAGSAKELCEMTGCERFEDAFVALATGTAKEGGTI